VKNLALMLAVMLGAGPALALSCLPPDVARTYKQATEAQETYVVVLGRLSFDETKLPKADMERQQETPPETLIPARIEGTSLSQAGFETPFNTNITLNARCFGPWCAGASSGTRYLAFLERTPEGYVLSIDPCGGFGFAEPRADMIEKVIGCFRGEACKPNPF